MPLASNKESLAAYRQSRRRRLWIDGGLRVPFGRAAFARDDTRLIPAVLSYPLQQLGRRLADIVVQPGSQVRTGELLARAEGLELRASCRGTVSDILPSRRRQQGHIKVEVAGRGEQGDSAAAESPGARAPIETMRRYAEQQGIWAEIQTGMEMTPPELTGDPRAIVVRCVFAEPYTVRGDAVISEDLDAFLNGLETLYRLGGGHAAIELTFTAPGSELGRTIRERLRGRAFVHTVQVPVRYPVENPLLLATVLGKAHSWGPDDFWMLDPQTVVGLHRAFENGDFFARRLVAVAGPGVKQPALVETVPGAPLGQLVKDHLGPTPLEKCCLLRGGLYSGIRADAEEGLAYGDRAVTVIPEDEEDEFLGWLRPGFDRHSWTKLFASRLWGPEAFGARTLVRGGLRACVGCGFCRQVCPAGLYPHHLHRLVTHDLLEEAEQLGLLNCVECHSCSYGCVSKIELSRDIVAARRRLLHEEEE